MNSDEIEAKAEATRQDMRLPEVYGIEIDELDMLEFEGYSNLDAFNDSKMFKDSDYMVELIEDFNFK